MLKRSSLFVRGLLHQCKKHRFRAELIIVEWNPPEGKPLLKDMFPLPSDEDYLTIRFIIVPNEVHRTFKHSEKMPLFQMIAKNVGIRRAKGEFVLCTNVDLLFSGQMFDFFNKKQLEEGHYYRANRCDIPKDINYDLDIESLLHYSRKNILNRLGKDGRLVNLSPKLWFLVYFPRVALLTSWLLKHMSLLSGPKSIEDQFRTLDTFACGDFTLMSKKDWLSISGYAEFQGYSIHIDSLAIYSAYATGMKQVILHPEECTFHVSHEDGWERANPIKKLFQDIERPMLDWSSVEQAGLYLLREKIALEVNEENWGLMDFELKEYTFEPENKVLK